MHGVRDVDGVLVESPAPLGARTIERHPHGGAAIDGPRAPNGFGIAGDGTLELDPLTFASDGWPR